MSAEADFLAALSAYVGLTVRVQKRIAQNAADANWPVPYLVFTSERQTERTLSGAPVTAMVSFELSCWAKSAAGADQIADLATTALDAVDAVVTMRATAYESDLDLNATILTVEWWDD